MNKEELKQWFEANGGKNVARKHPQWNIAFDMYQKEKNTKLSRSCGGCYSKVYTWLQK